MPTVIIIGFGYTDLPSAITDIYRVYSAHFKLGHRIYIGSDIIKASKPKGIVNLLADDSIGEDFVPFIERDFVKMRTLISDRDTLINFLNGISITDDHHLIFYYTGHGHKNSFRLPDKEVFSSFELRDKLLKLDGGKVATPDSQILIILDCCNPHGLYLPFRLNLTDEEEIKYIHISKNFVIPQILLIASTDETEISEAFRDESPFTKFLYKALFDSRKPYDLRSIVVYINSKVNRLISQKCVVYSSRVSIEMFWSWVVSKYDINFDPGSSAINFVL